MTTKETASATADAKPKDGEQLLYIDWQGKRVYGKTHTAHAEKKAKNDK